MKVAAALLVLAAAVPAAPAGAAQDCGPTPYQCAAFHVGRGEFAAALHLLDDLLASSPADLKTLNLAGINPFNVFRAESRPEPKRFPVLLRHEDDHRRPLTNLVESQAELDEALEDLRASGVPLRGILVIEFCAEPYCEGLWHKWGT